MTDFGRIKDHAACTQLSLRSGKSRKVSGEGHRLPSDAFIFDLEDSVPPAEKANARTGVRAYAGKISDNRVWVRVNASTPVSPKLTSMP